MSANEYALKYLIGRRIKAIVKTKTNDSPKEQVFLIFDDDHYYEFYSSNLGMSGSIYKGNIDDVINYANVFPGTKIHVYK